MPTARASLAARLTPRTAQRGQVMPIFALIVLILVMFVSLMLDGTFAFQTYRDLDTIAYHAARAGANQVKQPCQALPGTNCALDQAQAAAEATSWANSWAAQDKITIKSMAVTFPSADTIQVSMRVCYQFFIPIVPVSSAACASGWQLDSVQVAHSLVGP